MERVQRLWDEHVFNHRAYDGEARARAFNRLKYVSYPFFFNYYLRVRRDSTVQAIQRFTVQRGAVIETIAINYNMNYEKHRKRKIFKEVHNFYF